MKSHLLDQYTQSELIKQYDKERIDYYYKDKQSSILNNKDKWDWVKYLKDNNVVRAPIRYGTNSNNWNDKSITEQFQNGVSVTAYFINIPDGYYIPLMDIKYNDYIKWIRQNKLNDLIE